MTLTPEDLDALEEAEATPDRLDRIQGCIDRAIARGTTHEYMIPVRRDVLASMLAMARRCIEHESDAAWQAGRDRLDTAIQDQHAAEAKAIQYERDWYDAKSEFGTARAKMREQVRAAEAIAARRLEVLRRLEWSGTHIAIGVYGDPPESLPCCPVCRWLRNGEIGCNPQKHSPECALWAEVKT